MKESKESVTLEKLGKLVQNKVCTYMKNYDATIRVQNFSTDYHTLLARNGLEWLIKDNPKIAVEQVLFPLKPRTLHDFFEAYFSFAKYELLKNFHVFLKHGVCLAEAFQIVASGSTPRGDFNDTKNNHDTNRNGGGRQKGRGHRSRNGCRSCRGGGSSPARADTEDQNEELPLCLWEPHRHKGRHKKPPK